MRLRNVIPKIGGVVALVTALDSIISGFLHPWFAVAWGIITAIACFRTEIISWGYESSVKLSPQLQFALVLLLVLIAVITTHWTALGRQDMFQWVYVSITLLLYRHGLARAWSHLTHAITR